ncbi:hypothetical protein TIFTF001_029054 [Ficus carica]|uniref:Uncharacterized protein n=1 Tax=Ficus carica TaxID=3494 RepID=A0AA88J1Y2_FICCA|nr:hypothetical protein TIFTF001_029054 [Ficus carica]
MRFVFFFCHERFEKQSYGLAEARAEEEEEEEEEIGTDGTTTTDSRTSPDSGRRVGVSTLGPGDSEADLVESATIPRTTCHHRGTSRSGISPTTSWRANWSRTSCDSRILRAWRSSPAGATSSSTSSRKRTPSTLLKSSKVFPSPATRLVLSLPRRLVSFRFHTPHNPPKGRWARNRSTVNIVLFTV